MPNIAGVRIRVHFNDDARSPVLHERGRSWNVHLEDEVLGVYDEHGSRIASHAAGEWAWVELVHGEPAVMTSAWVKGGGPGCGCGCRDATEDPAEQPEGSTFTWPYDPTSGTVSTDDVVEQAKHEAADHIRRAKAVARGEDLLGFVDELERTADVLAVVADGASDAPHRERRVRTLRTIAARLRAIVQSDDEAAA